MDSKVEESKLMNKRMERKGDNRRQDHDAGWTAIRTREDHDMEIRLRDTRRGEKKKMPDSTSIRASEVFAPDVHAVQATASTNCQPANPSFARLCD